MNLLNTRNLCKCSVFICLITIGAFIKIPVPYVPFTLQFLFTTLAGIFLGSKLGGFSVLIYVIMGVLGFPVFAGGVGGFSYIFKPTFGYLIGFIVGAFFTGYILENKNCYSFKVLLFASLVGLTIVYIFGLVYYYLISKFVLNLDITISTILIYGFVLAVPGDILLCFLSSLIGKNLKKFIL